MLLRGREGQGTELKLEEIEAGKWTRLRVQLKGGVAMLYIADLPVQRVTGLRATGSLGLMDTGAAMEFGNLHVREIPK